VFAWLVVMCRFKPAPIYILDEVDAALDLNHTQNIGAMIKQHFPQVRHSKLMSMLTKH
jgi:structural maintenance of chromosome 2